MAHKKPARMIDWHFGVQLRVDAQIPLRTTRVGVKRILNVERVPHDQTEDFTKAIEEGGPYEPVKSENFLRVVRLPPSIEEELFLVCTTIKHDGTFGVCWWHTKRREVWWCYHEPDTDPARIRAGLATPLDDIKRMFNGVKKVQKVRLVCEGHPDPFRDHGWIKIFLGRFW